MAKSALEIIPGVGPSLSRDLEDLGFHTVAALRNADPEKLYADLRELRGRPMDRCVLYVFRCAVYFASEADPDAEKLKWWSWKDPK